MENDLPRKLGAPAERALAGAGIQTLEQLTRFSEAEIKRLHGVGPNALGKLRDALAANGLSYTQGRGLGGTREVDAFMDVLDHPFKAEVQSLREIILNVSENIAEQVKWKAPSFSYKGYMATFNLWEQERVHLIFHNGAILNNASGLLEGDYPDRRMLYFTDMEDVKSKKAALEDLVRQWIALMDQQK